MTVEAIKVLLNQYLKDTKKLRLQNQKVLILILKLKIVKRLFAIDIKANEDSKNPWFDMAVT